MQTIPLNASPRQEQGKGPARRLRSQGLIPSVAYGAGNETIAVTIDRDMLRTILTTGRGRNTVIELNVDGKGSFPVMVKDYSVHPVSRNLLHADFIHVDTTKPLVVEVPFHTTGKSVGVAQGGTLLTTVRSLKVKCIPAKIPDFVEHDVSALDINDVLKVSELSVPEGVEVLMEADRKVAMVAPPRVEAEPTAEEGEEGAEGEEGEEGADGATTEGAKGDDAKPDGGGDKRS